jgi:RNA polymerase sigma factor (sigma-70 family)
MSAKATEPCVTAVAAPGNARPAWPDARLVRECLKGNEEAWSALIDKYKRLVFSIPIKYGFSTDDATDIFQSVCVELLTELPKLREPKALPKWLMQITAHKCLHRKRQQARMESSDEDEEFYEPSTPSVAEGILLEAQQDQSLREALLKIPPRCRQLIEMLFFEEPSRPYQQVAQSLRIATGSIGFIRQRCLERLRKQLLEVGFR